jgi:HemY protein
MIRLLLIICSCLALGGLLYYLIEQDSGYFLIVWGKTSIEMSLWFAIIALAVLIIVLLLVIYLLLGGYRNFTLVANSIFGYNSRIAEERTLRGMLYFIEGNWFLAKRNLVKSAKKTSSPIINYLAAARSAYELGDQKEALQLLHQAEKSTSNSSLAVALTQVRMQLVNKHYEQALATLARAANNAPNHPMVLEFLKQTYTALKDWSSLIKLLPRLHKYKIGNPSELLHLEERLYREWLADTIEQSKNLTTEQRTDAVRECWSQIPKKNRYDVDTLTLYIGHLMDSSLNDEAEQLLESSLKKHWHDQWVDLYGQLATSDAKRHLLTAEGWLKSRPNNSALLLTIGRLCLRNQQWGRAKEYLKASLKQQERPDTYAELARLLTHLGETEDSSFYYQKGLLMTISNLPKFPQPKLVI